MRTDLSSAPLFLILTSKSFHGYFLVQNGSRFKFLQTFHLLVFAMSEELILHISFLSILFFMKTLCFYSNT